MNSAEKTKLDDEIAAFNAIVAALGTIETDACPRILGATAIIYGIKELPVVVFAPRPV